MSSISQGFHIPRAAFQTFVKDCYADQQQWDQIHEMLKDAFLAVPAISHRRLWALRMLALSHQGKNVTVAMGKMKDRDTQEGFHLNLAWLQHDKPGRQGGNVYTTYLPHPSLEYR